MINACVSPHEDIVSMSSVSSVSQPNETMFITTTPEGSTLPDGVTIVWLDASANSNSNDSSTTRLMLHEIHSHIRTFDDANLCRNFLSTITNRKSRVFLIVSGKLSSIILSNLATLTAIDSVFIFCAHPEAYENLMVKYSSNVIGVFSQLKSLKSSLEAELSNYVVRAPIFNFFAQKQKSIRDLTHDAASFLWFQLFQKLLMKNTYDNSDMKHMIDYCRKHYQRNIEQHKFFSEIDEFEKNYISIDAISWYTRQSFVYKLINSALRTEDIEALYIFRCYISDLCRALANEHKTFRIQNKKSPVLTLYRGSHMTSKELDKLRDTIGGITSINGFISTSRQQYVAEVFASRDSHRGPDTHKVVWIIEANSRSDDIVFASVVHHSQHSHEEEVLFNIGTTLCVHDVIMNEATNMWHIKATATYNGANVVADYMELLRCELNETSEKVVFGMLLIDMGKYETAQHYFEDLISRNSDHNNSDLPAYHYNLALTHSFQGAYNLAEINFHQALECQKFLPLKQRNRVRTLNALGWIHQDDGQLSKAIKYYIEAESICIETFGSNDLANAQTYTYMGRYYLERQQYNESNTCYEHALEILRLHLPKTHQRFGIILSEMGDAQRRQGKSQEALGLYQQAEAVFHDILPQYHPCMAYCWSGMGLVYLQLNDIEEARRYHKKALKTYQRVLPPNHSNISISEKHLKCINYKHIIDGYIQVCAQL